MGNSVKSIQNNKDGYLLLYEWDGKVPPSSWYARLHSYGLWVRGSKEQSPIDRRASVKGFVFQEGAIFVESPTFARLLATHARSYGASNIIIATTSIQHLDVSPKDQEVIDKILHTMSRRGPRPNKHKGSYIVTCFEEARSYQVQSQEEPMVCPTCGSISIIYRKGTKLRPVRSAGSVYDQWLAIRFQTGAFEICPTATNAVLIDLPSANLSAADTDGLAAARHISDVLSALPRNTIFRAMDIAYCVAYNPPSKKIRIERRSVAMRKYYSGGGDRFHPMSAPVKNGVDLIDIAYIDGAFIKYL